MTVVSRSLDDLDRLAFRLSRVVRTQYPQLLHQGFTLTDLEERLLPYRDVRREMADGGPDAFESALLRLIAGDRGYLDTDPALQTACRHALGFPSPTIAMIRSWSTTTLMLVPGSGAITPTSGAAVRATPAMTDVFPSPRAATSIDSRSGARAAVIERVATPKGTRSEGARAVCSCRYCDSRLPEARRVTFCPHCGMDLTKKQCPACSTELDVQWKYCVTCGRSGD
ncbi:MAG: zinc ribbon domain-containing protein [Gemmatimonadaceae bacterium]|nr:zinc ribbon domain-containing protein [Gemmatimonadaceae bacterium]